MKCVKFRGNYKDLKGMGYTFQKLHAGNYMQWYNSGYRVWKLGSEVTHDALGESFVDVLELLINYGINSLPYKQSNVFPDYFYITIYQNRNSLQCTLDGEYYRVGLHRELDHLDDHINPWRNITLTKETLSPIIELYNKNWIEIATY